MLALLIVSLVALFTQYAHAQVVKFAKTYGGTGYDYAYSVQQTSDGGYIVAGYMGSFSGVASLIKVDANGNIIWAKGIAYGMPKSVQQTSDGGYIVAGYTGADAFLIKTDANGNLQWAGYIGTTGSDNAYSVQQTSDGGYIVTGFLGLSPAYPVFLVKTYANGNLQWYRIYRLTGSVGFATSVQQTSDGGYIVAGNINNATWDFFLIKTDALGYLQWAKIYNSGGEDWAYSVKQTSDGGYIVASSAGGDAFLIKTDASGNVQWAKTYGGTGYDQASSVQQTSDGGYIVAGYTNSFGAGYDDIFLIKTDANGNIGSCGIVKDTSPIVNNASFYVNSSYISSLSLTIYGLSSTAVTSLIPTVTAPCPLSDDNELGISESCQIASGLITPYKGGIKVSESGEFEVKVYNVSGIMVKSVKGKNEIKFELSRGVYFVEVVSGGKVIREKVVIR
jgi:hypothetical protein